MGDQNLRVWPIEDDGYGAVVEYPASAKSRLVPIEPGATGPANTDLVVTARGEPGTSVDDLEELGRHRLVDVLVVWPGQPTPTVVLDSERDRRTTVSSSSSVSSTKDTSTKAGQSAKASAGK